MEQQNQYWDGKLKLTCDNEFGSKNWQPNGARKLVVCSAAMSLFIGVAGCANPSIENQRSASHEVYAETEKHNNGFSRVKGIFADLRRKSTSLCPDSLVTAPPEYVGVLGNMLTSRELRDYYSLYFEPSRYVIAEMYGPRSNPGYLQSGDVVLSIDGREYIWERPESLHEEKSVTSKAKKQLASFRRDFQSAIDSSSPIHVRRDERELDVSVPMEERCDIKYVSRWDSELKVLPVVSSYGDHVLTGEVFDHLSADEQEMFLAHELAHHFLGHYDEYISNTVVSEVGVGIAGLALGALGAPTLVLPSSVFGNYDYQTFDEEQELAADKATRDILAGKYDPSEYLSVWKNLKKIPFTKDFVRAHSLDGARLDKLEHEAAAQAPKLKGLEIIET